MNVSILDENIKPSIEEVLVTMMREKRDLFYDIILEAIEDVALANAIQEGREDRFTDEGQILTILEG